MKSLFSRKQISPRLVNSQSSASQNSRTNNALSNPSIQSGSRRPSCRLRQRLVTSKLISFGMMTCLGWAALSSLGTPPTSESGPAASVQQTSAQKDIELSAAGFQLSPLQSIAKANDAAQISGTQLSINGQTYSGHWQQKNGRVGISVSSLANLVGVELLTTSAPAQQPIRWFPATQDGILSLPAWWDSTNRYVDIADLAVTAGWTSQPNGNTLQLTMPAQRTTGIRQGKQTWGDRIVVDVTGPATWQLDAADTYTVTVGSAITPEMVRAFRATQGNLITQLHVAPLRGQTVLKIKTKDGANPQIWTAGNPNRVVIDIRRDAMVERDIAWAPGLRWRQQYVSVGAHRFPVYMFITQPNPATLALRPIHANPNTAAG
ncbi:MAG: hypothetical protein AAFQ63_07270, partial [Cyanobacteria bacterium J06621_11]